MTEMTENVNCPVDFTFYVLALFRKVAHIFHISLLALHTPDQSTPFSPQINKQIVQVSDRSSGIGIDDMFVICQSLDNLMPKFAARWQRARTEAAAAASEAAWEAAREEEIVELVGQTMKHAGVAITVTSVTDIIVFAIGATTVREICGRVCYKSG